MLSVYEIKEILRGKKASATPVDDFKVIDSYALYDESKMKKAGERALQYLCYEIESMNPETGETIHFYKALKFLRIIRLPKSAKQSTSFMDIQQQILTGVYENGYNLVTIIANIIEPVPLGLLFLYGVQGVGNTIEEAKEQADADFIGLTAALQGSFRVLEMKVLNAQETEWLREKMYNMSYMTVVRGIPKANSGGEDMGNKGIGGKNLNPDSQGTLEEFIAGMVDYEYVVQVLSSPVRIQTLKEWSRQTEKHMTDWNSQLQGTKALSFNISMPMMFMANQGASQGWSKGYTDADSVTTSTGESFTSSIGESVSQSLSRSITESMGVSKGTSVTDTVSQSQSFSEGVSFGQSIGQSVGQSIGQAVGQSVGQNASVSSSVGQSQNISQGQSVNQSTNTGYSESQGVSEGRSFGQSFGESSSSTHSVGSSQSTGLSTGETISQSESASVSQSHSEGASSSSSQGLTLTTGQSTAKSDSHSEGISGGATVSGSTSINATLNTTNSKGVTSSSSFSGGIGASFIASGSLNFGSNESTTSSASISEGSGAGSSVAESYNAGYSANNSSSVSSSNSFSSGETNSFSVGKTSSVTTGGSTSESVSHSNSVTQNNTWGASESYSTGKGATYGESYGVSQGVNSSQSISQGISKGWGESLSRSEGVSINNGYSQGQSLTNSLTNSSTNSYSNSSTQSQSTSQSVSQGLSRGQSVGSSESSSYTRGTSQGVTDGTSSSRSMSEGSSNSTSVGKSLSSSAGSSGAYTSGASSTMGFGPSVGYNKSYMWLDQQVKDILELLEYQNERLKKSLRGEGAFYTYVYIACPSLNALSAAQSIAKATWQNEYAYINPVQVLRLTNDEQQHLLYHFSAFSVDVTRENVSGVMQSKYSTILLPSEYVAYTHLPRISEGGVFADVNDIPKLAVPSGLKGEIYMGTILSAERYSLFNGYSTPFDFRIDESELMHGFFTGASRSGKTVAAMRFVAELANVRRKDTGKRLRIVCMDPKRDWRTLARFVDPERFRFHSLGNAEFRPVKINPLKIPHGVVPQTWIDGVIDIYCRAYGLLERGKQMMGETIYQLYEEAGVFSACEKNPDNWRDIVSDLSGKVTFTAVYQRMSEIKLSLEDPKNPKGRAGNDTRDAYTRLLDRLQCFSREFTIEHKLFGTSEGIAVDELIGADDVTILESSGLEKTFKNFIFGIITSGFYKWAKAHEGGYLAPNQYETVLVIEEANEVLLGNDCAGGKGGTGMTVSGQSEFEEILDQSAGYGLFVIAITQKIADMPKSIISNSGLVFAGRLKTEDDVKVVIRSVAREERYDDRDLVKWFPRMATGMFVCQRSRTFDFKDAEPILVQIARLNAVPPSNLEIEEILTEKLAAI